MSIINEADQFLINSNKKRKSLVGKKVSALIKEKTANQSRLESLTDLKELEKMNRALTALTVDLIDEGFAKADIERYVKDLLNKAMKAIFKTNKELGK